MVRYIVDSEGDGVLWRDPDDVREEIVKIWGLLGQATARMKVAQEAGEALSLSLSEQEDYSDGVKIKLMEVLCEECDELRQALSRLEEEAAALCEELEDSLWWMKGGVSS